MATETLTVRVVVTGRRGARYAFDLQGSGSLEWLLAYAKREGEAFMQVGGAEFDAVTVAAL